MTPVLVNLGCGTCYHQDWLNFDMHPVSPDVRACNLLEGVPLPDASVDAVYNAALLEHLPRDRAGAFLRECQRILRPGGILRIGVPDLEQIARVYLEKLGCAAAGAESAPAQYDWILLEVLDQMTRTQPGGEMLRALSAHSVDEQFVQQRIGDEYRMLQGALAAPRSRLARLRQMPRREALHRIVRALRNSPRMIRRALAGLILSRADALAMRQGFFHASGEVHQWMYDRWSLVRLLEAHGFRDATIQSFATSRIAPDWPRYHLDTNAEGRPRKPDLLFVEAVK
jgi:predicted SAM-dependent methyltransferase